MIRPIVRLGLRGFTLLAMLGLVSAPAQATKYWKNSVATGNWNTGTNWSAVSPAGADNGGVPVGGEAVNIVFTDGTARTVTYDVFAPSLGALSVDLTGAGATTSTLSIPANSLTSTGLYVGGYSGGGPTAGRGTLNQAAGTVTTNVNSDLILGHGANSIGGYTLSGGTLTANQSELIGYSGTGTFTQTAGTNTINTSAIGFFSLGNNVNSTGNYNLSGTGSLSINAPEYIGNSGTGTFTQNGGTNSINSGTNGLYLGFNASSGNGTYTLNAGALSVSSLSAGEYIGYSKTGAFNQTGGTNTIANVLQIGSQAGSTGTYTLSGTGSLTTSSEYVGSNGTGTFIQMGGTNNIVSGPLLIAATPTSTGTFTLSGGSTNVTNASFSCVVGGISQGVPGGTGVLNVSGTGVLTVAGTLQVVTTPGTAVNLSGGTINVSALNVNGVPARFNWTGGKLNVTSNVTWDSAAAGTTTSAAFGSSLALGSDQTLMVTGNETIGGTGSFGLTLNSGGTHYVTGGITLSPTGTITQNAGSTLNAATFTQAGGTVNGTLQNQGNFIYQSGQFNGRLLNQGTVNLGPNFTAPNGLENDASITVAVGQTLTVNGAGLDNQGSFILAGGTVGGAGPMVNNSELTGHGTLSGAGGFSNNGLMTVSGGTQTLSNSGTNANSGQIDIPGGQQLRLTGGNLDNTGTINLGGGTVGGTATLNNTTGIISGHGVISSPLNNAGFLIVDSGILNITPAFANSGQIFLDGGPATLSGGSLTNNNGALISGTGRIINNLTNAATGTVRATGNEQLVFAGATNLNNGNFELIGGTLEFTGAVTNSATASVSGYGALHTSTASPGGLGITNNGVMQFSGGNTAIRGDVNNTTTGKVFTAGGSVTTFFDDVNNNGQILTIAGARSVFIGSYSGAGSLPGTGTTEFVGDTRPGNSPASILLGGNAVFDTTANLFIELGGITPGSQYDQLRVTGQLALGGTLKINLIDLGAGLFAPNSGDSFDILDWGNISGIFSAIQLPTLAGTLAWNTSQLYTTGVLSVVSGLPGDYNNNGVVDAPDYVLWRKNNNTAITLPNDSTAGTGPADYDVWRVHFGQPSGSGSGSGARANAAIPEPSTFVLLILAAANFCPWRHRNA